MQYDILPGRSGKNAKKALKLAEERGFDPTEVLTFRDGYYVPVEDDAAEETTAEEETEKVADEEKPAPKTTRKRASTKKE